MDFHKIEGNGHAQPLDLFWEENTSVHIFLWLTDVFVIVFLAIVEVYGTDK